MKILLLIDKLNWAYHKRFLMDESKGNCTNSECPHNNPQPLDNFYRRQNSPKGYFSRCKTCTLKKQLYRDKRSEVRKKRDDLLARGLWTCIYKKCLYVNPQLVCNFRIKRINKKTGRTTYHSLCKKCERLSNKELLNVKKQWRRQYLMSHPCVQCGHYDWRVLEFHHHQKNKYKTVAYLIRSAKIGTVIKEAKKCRVLCRNCHMKFHYSNRKSTRSGVLRNRNYDLRYKRLHPCSCGENNPAALVYHHRDPKTKINEVSQMMNKGRLLDAIKLEIKKCDVVCHNCHVIIHWRINESSIVDR